MILVSACLVGKNVKYNGKNNKNNDVLEYLKDKEYIEFCPEELGGLPTPRSPVEIKGGDGLTVFNDEARVVSISGEDYTEAFVKGAKKSLDIALNNNVTLAILKSNSPSCGKNCIYDGSFSNKIINGNGVTAEILLKNNIKVISEHYVKNICNIK